MAFDSFRDFLHKLEASGELERISQPVATELEITELANREMKSPGGGKALLIDFNYDVEPLPGRYPVPGAGPFRLLGESAVNHRGKLAFRWMYWHLLLPGRPIPLPAHMSMAGKTVPDRGAPDVPRTDSREA